MTPADVRRLAKWTGATDFAIATVDLLVVDPAETVTPDVLRLYRDADPVSASWFLVAGGWATGAWLLMKLAVDALLPSDALPARRGLVVAGLAATLGGRLLSSVVPMFFVGFGQYSVAEDRGYAPSSGTLGTVCSACHWARVDLIAAAALVAALALMARGLNMHRNPQ